MVLVFFVMIVPNIFMTDDSSSKRIFHMTKSIQHIYYAGILFVINTTWKTLIVFHC